MISLRAAHQYPGGSWPGCIFLKGAVVQAAISPCTCCYSLTRWDQCCLPARLVTYQPHSFVKATANVLSVASSNEEVSSGRKRIFCSWNLQKWNLQRFRNKRWSSQENIAKGHLMKMGSGEGVLHVARPRTLWNGFQTSNQNTKLSIDRVLFSFAAVVTLIDLWHV